MRATHKPLTVVALLLAMFMSAMEATVVSTAMPTVISELGGLARYGWIGASYLLASTVTVPLYGKLADLYGRKPVLLGGIVLFLLGSLGSGAATSIDLLIFARVVQGLGAGAMQPVTLTIIGDLFTLEQRGKIQGAFSAVWGLAGVSGPLLGGLIVHALSWRWVFWINVPFGVASMAVLSAVYREDVVARARPRIDWAGSVVLTLAALAILLGAGGELPAVMLTAGALGVALFVWIERHAAEPVLPMDLLLQRPIAVASLSALLLGAAMMGTVMFVPLYVQGVLGRSPTEAGSTIAPMLVGWPLAALVASRMLVRVGFRAPIWAGSAVAALSLVLFTVMLGAHLPLLALQSAMFLFGIGLGLCNTALIIAVQSGVAHAQRGVATATSLFSRSMGGALGTGALGAVLATRLGRTMSPEQVRSLLDPEKRRALDALGGHISESLGAGLAPVFYATSALALINLLVVVFYPRGEAAPAPAAEPLPVIAD